MAYFSHPPVHKFWGLFEGFLSLDGGVQKNTLWKGVFIYGQTFTKIKNRRIPPFFARFDLAKSLIIYGQGGAKNTLPGLRACVSAVFIYGRTLYFLTSIKNGPLTVIFYLWTNFVFFDVHKKWCFDSGFLSMDKLCIFRRP